MPLYSFEGKSPSVHPEAWVAPTATLIGDVTVEAGASIWYGVVIRADFGPVVIREGANVQDNSVIHVGMQGCDIGRGATIGHLCMIHSATIGERSIIANSSTVLDGARVGARTMVAAGSTVTPDSQVPDEVTVMGSPISREVPLAGASKLWVDNNTRIYQDLADRHRAGIELIEE